MNEDLINSPFGEDTSILGSLITDDLTHSLPHTEAFIVDPIVVVVDIARISPVKKSANISHIKPDSNIP
jgi:butyrate kinase